MAAQFSRTALRRALIGLAGIAVAACASMQPGRITAQTSSPKPVDPRIDNEAVLAELTPGLVFTLEIDGLRVRLANAKVMMIPRREPRRPAGELVSVTGLSGGQPVTQVQVPDQRLNVEEGKGIVILEKRTLEAALPLPRRIDALEVMMAGAERPQRFDVTKAVRDFCRNYPKSGTCRAPGPDEPGTSRDMR